MGFLDRLFGKKQEAAIAIDDEPAEECPHGALAPHWGNVADFGKSDLVAFYICESCETKLGREEGEAAMAKAGEIVRIDDSMRKQIQDAEERGP